MKRIALALLALFIFGAAPVRAELQKDNLVVIANKNSKEGLALAKYYVSARGLSDSQLILLDLPSDETIDRDTYDSKLIGPLREKLESGKLAGKTRALLTTFGVPLRVSAPEARGDEKQALLEALSFRKQARETIEKVIRECLEIAGEKLPEPAKDAPEESDNDLVARARKALNDAVTKLGAETDQEKGKTLRQKMNQQLALFGGVALVSQSIKIPEGSANKAAEDALAKVRHDVQQAYRILQTLDETRTAENRKRGYALAAQTFGSTGVLGRANVYIKMYEYKEADAAVDSELSFLWWERDQYLLSQRMPNPFYHRLTSEKPFPIILPIMMVSRIDASDADKARAMIDRALEAEKAGLKGKAYIDARGMKAEKESFGLYDESLRELEDLIDDETEIETEIENSDKRWDSPGDAPDVALYAGWYRLRHYEDAFTFKPGAIGVHIASEEAVSLHDPSETGWCKNAIDRGITATMGAVSEPYLDAFPLPLEFFGLLLTGKYTLLEAYVLTTPYASWRLLLLGDPLYKPFREQLVTGEQLADRSEGAKSLNPLPPSPAEKEFPDPIATRKQIGLRREKMAAEVDAFYKALDQKLKQQNAKEKK